MASIINFSGSTRFRSPERRGARKGFSLVEIMVAAGEGVLLTALVLGIFTTGIIVGVSVGNYSDMHDRSKIAMTRFESDFRETNRVTAFSPTGVTAEVLADFDPAAGTGTPASITYAYNPTARTLTKNGVTVLPDVESCSFAYFNSNDTPLTGGSASSIRKILITASMRRTNLNRFNSDYMVSAVVMLRTPQ